MEIIGKCEKCKRNLVRLYNGNVVCGCTDKGVDEMLRMWAERKGRMRKMKKLIEKLRKYNAWRRGDETVPQPHPQEVGEMIDQAIKVIEAEFEEWEKNKEGGKCTFFE